MKKRKMIFGLVLCLGLITAGCGPARRTAEAPKPVYSNLTENSVRLDLDALMDQAGIPAGSRRNFFDHVDQINEVAGPDRLTRGLQPFGEPLYDAYDLQEDWQTAYPDFYGYNCRITAYGLAQDALLDIGENPVIAREDNTMFDLYSLEEDPGAVLNPVKFRALFSTVPTEANPSSDYQAQVWLKSWEDRGIRFQANPHMSLITMVFHSDLDGDNTLFAGHAGILFPTPDNSLWFVEKLTFQEPYQVVVFSSRQQLQDYLTEKYDLDENQPTARPFILENDHILKY